MRAAHFPSYRPRRLRSPLLRGLIAESSLEPGKLIAPLFVTLGTRRKSPIPSMPGVFRFSVEAAVAESKALAKLGVGGVLLFGIPARKDYQASGSYAEDGVIQRAIRSIKRSVKNLAVMTDVCLCEYTTHGHCGILSGDGVDNDATLGVLARVALSHARAGVDLVAPSAMMDGQVGAVRRALDQAGFSGVPIMGYSAKYASALYGPFREAVESAPKFGDRRGYQMDPRNAEEALREVALDIEEGADIVMVKPAISALDVIRSVKETFHWPTAAYQVSGEYSLVKAAVSRGWFDEKRLVLELATGIKRAGADILITYYAKELAQWLP